jgi:hypothetical protein
MPDHDHGAKSGLVAKYSGFSLHAGVQCLASERDKLERVCRYIARPAISGDRLSVAADGSVIYRLKKPWNDGTSAVKFTAMELIERSDGTHRAQRWNSSSASLPWCQDPECT